MIGFIELAQNQENTKRTHFFVDHNPNASGVHHLLLTHSFDISVFLLSCLLIYAAFLLIKSYTDRNNRKSHAWIIMLISSPILSTFGTIYVGMTQYYNLWSNDFIYGEDSLSRAVILFFVASNIIDLVIGWFNYREYLDPFTTVFHHIAYVVFMLGLLQAHITRGFLLCFFMEIPTFLLSLGTVFKQLRSDVAFGITFFITRLAFNLYLIIKLAEITNYEGFIWKICSFVLSVHIFWFYKWSTTYGVKAVRALFKPAEIKSFPVGQLGLGY